MEVRRGWRGRRHIESSIVTLRMTFDGEPRYIWVSTVRTGIGDEHEYETMIFSCDEDGEVKNWSEGYVSICATREEAKIQHEEVLTDLKILADVEVIMDWAIQFAAKQRARIKNSKLLGLIETIRRIEDGNE